MDSVVDKHRRPIGTPPHAIRFKQGETMVRRRLADFDTKDFLKLVDDVRLARHAARDRAANADDIFAAGLGFEKGVKGGDAINFGGGQPERARNPYQILLGQPPLFRRHMLKDGQKARSLGAIRLDGVGHNFFSHRFPLAQK